MCFRLFCSLLNRKYTFQHHLHLSLTSWSLCPPCCLRTVSLLRFLNTFRRSSMTCREVTQCFSENSALLINIVEMKAVGQALLSSLISTADSQGPDSILFHFESVRNIIILSIYLGYVLSKEPSKPCKLRIFNSKLFDYFSAVSLH